MMIHSERKVLDNGLTVIAEQDKSTTLAAVNILYKVERITPLPIMTIPTTII